MNNTLKSNSVENELDLIRIKLYEQTKDMTSEERVAYFNKMVKDGLAKHGIKLPYAPSPTIL